VIQNKSHTTLLKLLILRSPEGCIRYRDGAGNTAEENSSIFSLIRKS